MILSPTTSKPKRRLRFWTAESHRREPELLLIVRLAVVIHENLFAGIDVAQRDNLNDNFVR